MSEINGIYAASVSILDKNLRLDISKTIKHAENLIDQGCHGVAILGSTGQAQLISLPGPQQKLAKELIEITNSLSSLNLRNEQRQNLRLRKGKLEGGGLFDHTFSLRRKKKYGFSVKVLLLLWA